MRSLFSKSENMVMYMPPIVTCGAIMANET